MILIMRRMIAIYFDFDVSKINYDNFEDETIISKYNLRPDSIIVNYPAHHYWGYSSRFQKIFDSAEIMIVNCLGQFCEYLSEIDSYIEQFLDIFERHHGANHRSFGCVF